jgi:hypothetical protein
MNRNSDSILSVYSDARAEYTKQLCVFLVPAYFQFFIDLLEKAKQDMANEPKRALWQFQNYLNDIHDWNMEKVTNEIHKIHTNCGCDYMEDLLTAVFIAHTKVLTAIRLSSNKKKIEINVPKVEHFLFKVLCETSKLLWSSTYLFRDGVPGIEKQQNYRNIEQIINEGIIQAVRNLIPVKSILKDFVSNDETADEVDSDDEEEHKEDVKPEHEEIPELPSAPVSLPEVPSEKITESVMMQEKPTNAPITETPVQLVETPVESSVQIQNEIVEPTVEEKKDIPQTIIIDEKPGVRFGEFDAVFDSDNPMESDMIFEPKDEDDEEHVPALEILDDVGTPLAEGFDFENMDKSEEDGNLSINDYEEFN